MNNCHANAPFADVVFAMDRPWWNEYAVALRGCSSELWTTNREAARVYRLNHIQGEPGGGISTKHNAIRLGSSDRRGGNSGFQAVGLALLFGAAKVILLGYDMQLTGGRTHHHGDHKRLGNPTTSSFKSWRPAFDLMAGMTRVPIVNATRETSLTCFTRVPLAEALA